MMEELYVIEDFKANFRRLLKEIEEIVRGAYKEKEAVEKLEKVLSEEQITKIEEFIDLLRKKVKESEERAFTALQEAERYKNELEKEKERLEKLWDA